MLLSGGNSARHLLVTVCTVCLFMCLVRTQVWDHWRLTRFYTNGVHCPFYSIACLFPCTHREVSVLSNSIVKHLLAVSKISLGSSYLYKIKVWKTDLPLCWLCCWYILDPHSLSSQAALPAHSFLSAAYSQFCAPGPVSGYASHSQTRFFGSTSPASWAITSTATHSSLFVPLVPRPAYQPPYFCSLCSLPPPISWLHLLFPKWPLAILMGAVLWTFYCSYLL